MWNAIIWIITSVISYMAQPKPEQPKPASLSEFDVPTADPNRTIPVIFGTVWIDDPNVVWYGDLNAEPIPAPDADKK